MICEWVMCVMTYPSTFGGQYCTENQRATIAPRLLILLFDEVMKSIIKYKHKL